MRDLRRVVMVVGRLLMRSVSVPILEALLDLGRSEAYIATLVSAGHPIVAGCLRDD